MTWPPLASAAAVASPSPHPTSRAVSFEFRVLIANFSESDPARGSSAPLEVPPVAGDTDRGSWCRRRDRAVAHGSSISPHLILTVSTASRIYADVGASATRNGLVLLHNPKRGPAKVRRRGKRPENADILPYLIQMISYEEGFTGALMSPSSYMRVCLAVAVGLALTGCGGGGDAKPPSPGQLSIATDAPLDDASEVIVVFTGVELHRTTGETVSLDFGGNKKSIDLIKLQNGVDGRVDRGH